MTVQPVIDNDFVSLWYYPEKKIVHHKFKKYIYGQAFRDFMTEAADLFVKNGCRKWISDDRANSALGKEDLEWAAENWKPRVLGAGWKYWALLLPDKMMGRLSMRHLVEEYASKGVTVEIFSDFEEAFAWIAGGQ